MGESEMRQVSGSMEARSGVKESKKVSGYLRRKRLKEARPLNPASNSIASDESRTSPMAAGATPTENPCRKMNDGRDSPPSQSMFKPPTTDAVGLQKAERKNASGTVQQRRASPTTRGADHAAFRPRVSPASQSSNAHDTQTEEGTTANTSDFEEKISERLISAGPSPSAIEPTFILPASLMGPDASLSDPVKFASVPTPTGNDRHPSPTQTLRNTTTSRRGRSRSPSSRSSAKMSAMPGAMGAIMQSVGGDPTSADTRKGGGNHVGMKSSKPPFFESISSAAAAAAAAASATLSSQASEAAMRKRDRASAAERSITEDCFSPCVMKTSDQIKKWPSEDEEKNGERNNQSKTWGKDDSFEVQPMQNEDERRKRHRPGTSMKYPSSQLSVSMGRNTHRRSPNQSQNRNHVESTNKALEAKESKYLNRSRYGIGIGQMPHRDEQVRQLGNQKRSHQPRKERSKHRKEASHLDTTLSPHVSPKDAFSSHPRASTSTVTVTSVSKTSSNSSSSSGPSSVFRGLRTSPSLHDERQAYPPGHGPSDRGNISVPQRLLQALDSPPNSFEGNPELGSSEKDGSISPAEPPQIHHAHHQFSLSPHSFLFERSPKSISPVGQPSGVLGASLEAASFSLFNQSFESLYDAGQYFGGGSELDVTFSSFGATPAAAGQDDEPIPLAARPPARRGSSTRSTPAPPASVPHLNSQGSKENSSSATYHIRKSSSSSVNNMLAVSSMDSFGNNVGVGGSDSIGPTDCSLSPLHHDAPITLQYRKSYPSPGGSPPSHSQPRASDSGRKGPGNAHPHEGSSQTLLSSTKNQQYHAYPGTELPAQPHFYTVLRSFSKAFQQCVFLLPGLKITLQKACNVNVSSVGNITVTTPGRDNEFKSKKMYLGTSEKEKAPSLRFRAGQRKLPLDQAELDLIVATRRVKSAICAFGGTVNTKTLVSNTSSIFRTKSAAGSEQVPKASTDESSQQKYAAQLPTRYYEHGNRLSWEVEEKPPVEITDDEDADANKRKDLKAKKSPKKAKGYPKDGSTPSSSHVAMKQLHGQEKSEGPVNLDASSSVSSAMNVVPGSEPPKMKYRCKLCGKPKQNHTCPYQQSLQRSIGTMVYPAMNAFSSNEPGNLAPALSEMNNFIPTDLEHMSSESSPSRSRRDDTNKGTPSPPSSVSLSVRKVRASSPPNVTPESLRSTMHHSDMTQVHSPGSSLSGGTGTPQGTPLRRQAAINSPQHYAGELSRKIIKKRNYSMLSGDDGSHSSSVDLLFRHTMEIKPEQYRSVNSSKTQSEGAYQYPALPLPYSQRKLMSDSLFALSKEVPELTDECAIVLREAREKDMWDLAVAELMTQVIVVIHCEIGDRKLDGLKKYLSTIGIAC